MNAAAATSSSSKAAYFKFGLDCMCLTFPRDAVQKDFGEILCRGFVRNVQQAPIRVPKIVVERVMQDHAQEATHHDCRIDFDKRTLALSFANVAAQKFINRTHKL